MRKIYLKSVRAICETIRDRVTIIVEDIETGRRSTLSASEAQHFLSEEGKASLEGYLCWFVFYVETK